MEKVKKTSGETVGETVGVTVGGRWSMSGWDGGEDGGGAVEVQWGCSGGAVGVPKLFLKFDENYLKRINRWLKISEKWFFWPYRLYKNTEKIKKKVV